jgi:hypothetical protein
MFVTSAPVANWQYAWALVLGVLILFSAGLPLWFWLWDQREEHEPQNRDLG